MKRRENFSKKKEKRVNHEGHEEHEGKRRKKGFSKRKE
jgi:hypothetical protein